MQNTGGGDVRRIFVKVFGFSDVERHALNTVFRLSESRPVVYAHWNEDAPEKAQVALVDGDSWEATIELANPGNDKLTLIWVGERPASNAALVFERPLQWVAILEGLDGIYAPAAALDFDVSAPVLRDLDFDLDLDAIPDGHGSDADTTTEPAQLEEAAPEQLGERVLVLEADPDARLYLRAKLANAGLLFVDEAVTGAQALAFLATHSYVLALIDVGVADMDGWQLVGKASGKLEGTGHVVVMREKLWFLDKWRAHFAGAKAALVKPLHPRELKRLLADIGRPVRQH
ncbi:MAG: response regulator [Polaromonas sp.]|uniref:response regulator n=1 Tax=Polaromonas sp. TaxID=1869339 RepID=UPI0025F368BE|nr:response regulator [Polaromonas sp.]MBI2724993.1 response regulator [Polaromonas sp.]